MKTYVEKILVGIMGVVFMAIPLACNAASNCDDADRYPYINASLAMCSTHAYNIGATQNPTDANSRQAMNEVVALKTTVMTQQMYKQYEYLDAMVRRLKTQLEKAILTAKLEAAGAPTKSSATTGNTGSGQSGQALSSAYNCKVESGGFTGVMNCLTRNVNAMSAAVSTNVTQVRKQLDSDIKLFNSYSSFLGANNKIDEIKTDDKGDQCKDLSKRSGRQLQECLDHFRIQISSALYKYEQQSRQTNRQQ